MVFVEHWFGKGGPNPETIGFNLQIVLVHHDAEEAVLTPVAAPRVAANPLLNAVGRDSLTHQRDLVVDAGWARVRVNAALLIILEVIVGRDAAGDGAVLRDLLLHVVSA
jgi:hypothetical protein